MRKNSRILVTGSDGMVGKSLVKGLKFTAYTNIFTPNSKTLDLRNQVKVDNYFKKSKFDYVFHVAAKVGGILSNINYPAEFLYDNLMIQSNVIECARKYKVKKLLLLGSSCIYPRNCPQPMKEEHLLTGQFEPTNEAYALSKVSGLKLCKYYNEQYSTNFINIIPCNLYGPNDHFNEKSSHVIPALISKFHEAKQKNEFFVTLWGNGKAKREFLYVEDVSEAMIYFMNKYNADKIGDFVNIGYGKDITIKELSNLIKKIVGFKGKIRWDTKKPNGMPKKLLNLQKSRSLGWKPRTSIKEGIDKTYNWFLKNDKK